MMTPVQAMLWQIWKGWRWGLILGWIYLVVAAVIASFLPDIVVQTHLGAVDRAAAGQWLAIPCEFVVIHLIAVFSLVGENSLNETSLKGNGYSAKMFVLPVRTRTLVAWPMIWGSISIACVWFIISGFILRPTGNTMSIWWPAAALAVGLTMIQALSWLPIVQSWPRIFFAVPVLMSLVVVALIVAVFSVPEPIATIGFLACLPLTYLAGLHGVALARRGDAYDWRVWDRVMSWLSKLRKPTEFPFESMACAQRWFEFRTVGWGLPVLMASMVPVTLIVFLVTGHDRSGTARQFAIMLVMPALCANLFGSQLGVAAFPFIATRPISSPELIRRKLESAFFSTVLCYLPLVILFPLLFLRAGFFETLLASAREAGALQSVLVLVLGPVLLLAITWKGLVQNQWIGLAGRKWLTDLCGVTLALLVGIGIIGGLWVWVNPDLQLRLWGLAPWFVGGLLVTKLSVALGVVSALLRTRLVDALTVTKWIAIWTVVAVAVVLSLAWFVPEQYYSLSGLVAVASLAIPFSRIAVAPLALDWNRHR